MLQKQKHLGDERKATQLRLHGRPGFSVPGRRRIQFRALFTEFSLEFLGELNFLVK